MDSRKPQGEKFMLTSLRSFFAAPVFPEEEEKTRVAALLNMILNSLAALVAIVIFGFLLGGQTQAAPYLAVGIFFFVLLGLHIPKQRGHVKLASFLLVVLFIGVISITLATSGSVRTPEVIFLVFVSMVASLLVGRRLAMAVSIVNVLIVLGLLWAEINGLLPPPMRVSIIPGVLFAAGAILMTVLLNRTLENIDKAFARAHYHAQELRNLTVLLERRVAERTGELEERSNELAKAEKHSQALLSERAETARLAHLAYWEYDVIKDEFTFNDDFYTLMHTSAEKESGYKMSSAQYLSRFVHPEDQPVVSVKLRYLAGTRDLNDKREWEHRVPFGDGTVGYMRVRVRPNPDAGEDSVKLLGAHQDRTEQKRAEEALHEFENLYRQAIGSADAAAYARRYETEAFTFMGEKIFEMTGYTAEEITIAGFERLIQETVVHSASLPPGETPQPVRFGQLPSWKADYRILTRDGKTRWLADTSVEIRGTDGRPTGSVGFLQDITDRKQTEETIAKRAAELETVTQLATTIATIQEPDILLQTVVDLTKDRFRLYHAHIYLLNEVGDSLNLTAGAGEAGRTMVAQRHRIALEREQSLVARAARTQQGVVVNDVTQAPDFLPNPLLPDTRAELAVPLIAGNRVLGVLDLQADRTDVFTDEDVYIQTILAAQIAVALENVRSNEQIVKTLGELDALTRRLSREGWQKYLSETGRNRMGFVFEADQLLPVSENGPAVEEAENTYVKPVMIHGERIGQVVASEPGMGAEELQAILDAVSKGLSAHLENLRLTEEAQRRVNELRIVNEIGQALTAEVELLPILVMVVNKLYEAFDANLAYVALYDAERKMIEIPYILDHYEPIFDEPPFPLGEGINSTIIKTRQSVFINQDSERRLRALGAVPTISGNVIAKSFIGIPLTIGENVIGVITLQDTEQEGRFSESDMEVISTIATNVAVSLQNARTFAEIQRRALREAKINLIGQKIQSATTVQGALQTVIQELGLALKAGHTRVELKRFDKPHAPQGP